MKCIVIASLVLRYPCVHLHCDCVACAQVSVCLPALWLRCLCSGIRVFTCIVIASLVLRYPCVYLACKVEEFNVTISNFVGNMPQFSAQEAVGLVLSQELLLMQILYYHLTVHNPYRPVEGLLIDIKVRLSFITCGQYCSVWLGGRVVRTLDLRSTGREFESRPLRYRVQPWASC